MNKCFLFCAVLFCLWGRMFSLQRVKCYDQKKIRANFSYEIRNTLDVLRSYEVSYFNLDIETPGYLISISSLFYKHRKKM